MMGRPNQHQPRNNNNNNNSDDGGRRPSKRNHRQIDEVVVEIDDLAFAATFAMVGTAMTGLPYASNSVTDNSTANICDGLVGNDGPTTLMSQTIHHNVDEKIDDNEIEVDSIEDVEADSDDNNDRIIDEVGNRDEKNSEDDVDENDESDVESDIDLTEVLEKMHEVDDEEDPIVNSSNAPKTEHEVDVYKAPIKELERRMQMQLTVETEEQGGTISKWNVQQLSLAGRLKNFIVADRTVVVESIVAPPSSAQNYGFSSAPASLTQSVASGPLDEGSLLVVQVPATTSASTDSTEQSRNSDNVERDDKAVLPTKFIPLGRILEVFGPVSRPLYTIRLPQPPSDPNISAPLVTKKGKGRKNALNVNKEGTATWLIPTDDMVVTTGNSVVNEEEQLNRDDGRLKDQSDAAIDVKGSTESLSGISVAGHEPKAGITAGAVPPTTENDTAAEQCHGDNNLTSTSNDAPDNQPKLQSPKTDETVETTSKESVVNIHEPSVPKETNHADIPVTSSVVDPWAVNGEYTKFLTQKDIDIPVYFIPDEAKLIDTGFVMRASGKGCDASNVYDEEVVDSNEMYYSDDDVEREAKNKWKGSKSRGHQKSDSTLQLHQQPRQPHRQRGQHGSLSTNNPAPQGVHTPSVQGIPRGHGNTTRSNPPPGLPQIPPPPPPPPPIHQSTLPHGFHRTMPPPPPPPPGVQGYPVMYNNYVQYQGRQLPTPLPMGYENRGYTTMQGGMMAQSWGSHNSPPPPPPPPPRNPNEPAPYQY